MRQLRVKGILTAVVLLVASASLYGCVGPTMEGGRRFCNSSSGGCMALKMQQSKGSNIAWQQGRCCG
jgi:hypothetical protein